MSAAAVVVRCTLDDCDAVLTDVEVGGTWLGRPACTECLRLTLAWGGDAGPRDAALRAELLRRQYALGVDECLAGSEMPPCRRPGVQTYNGARYCQSHWNALLDDHTP